MNINLFWKQKKRKKAIIDFIIIGILGSTVYLISISTHAYKMIGLLSGERRFLGLQLDEVIVVFAFLGIAFSIFSVRRWNDLHYEMVERERLDEKLLESENKFRDLSEKSLVGVYLVQDGLFRYVNPILAETFGFALEDLIDRKGPSDLVHPEDLPEANENIRKRITGEAESFNYALRGVKNNGEIIHVKVYGSRTTYKDRPAIIGTLLDITESKLKARVLRESEERYRNLVDNAPDVIFTLSTEGKFTSLNPVFETLSGWPRNEWLGKSFVPLLYPDEVPLVMEMFQRALRGETPPVLELRILTKSGKYLIFGITSTPIFSDGKVVSVLGISRDITDRKRIEEHIVNQSYEITKRNMELSALYQISSAISQAIDMQGLFKNILNTVTEMDILSVKHQGGIFIVEGERMNLAAHLGHSEKFLEAHKKITIHDCLCGLAARKGEIIVSGNCHTDCRHTISYPGMPPHGHIIIPLKAANKVMGVLYLYLIPDTEVGESAMKTFASIGNQIGMAINNSMLYERARNLSLHDPLTKVANRNLMNIEIEKNLERAKRFGSPFSVIIMDLDNFKRYNDTFGHIFGDRLLVEVANILAGEVRTIDLVARYGGEEFLIALPDTDSWSALEVAERIRKSVEAMTPVTLSLGISSYSFGTRDMEALLKEADSALYQAKQKGKNRVEVGS